MYECEQLKVESSHASWDKSANGTENVYKEGTFDDDDDDGIKMV